MHIVSFVVSLPPADKLAVASASGESQLACWLSQVQGVKLVSHHWYFTTVLLASRFSKHKAWHVAVATVTG